MIKNSDEQLLEQAKDLISISGLLDRDKAEVLIGSGKASCRRIPSDGSSRKFWRVTDRDRPVCIVGAPQGSEVTDLAEARAAWEIGRHLSSVGAAVPGLFGRNEEVGLILFEDLGTVSLHDIVRSTVDGDSAPHGNIEELLRSVVRELAFMQCSGVKGFDTAWCWDTSVYSVALMVEKEAKYFLNAFWRDLLGQGERPGVEEELRDIASRAGEASADFFLHRDCQSRNIMISNGRPFFIDYQGGRLGPLGYDIASLLIDPYTRLPEELQEKLLAFYVSCLASHLEIEKERFLLEYELLALQRNLQIIGAYSFLYGVKGKLFFRQFLLPSLLMLQKRLRSGHLSTYRELRVQIDDSVKLVHGVLH
jgi:aminoglycoside/choline kinase family phosphotransferase